MKTKERKGWFSSPIWNSRIKSANVQASEMWLGYFVGPAMMYITYCCVAGSYLNQFYTDVLGIGGLFMTLMPAISKIIDAITNIIMGRIIDRTRTKQGKARPWLLISGPLVLIAGVLLYAIPKAAYEVQLIWIIVSYNLYFSFAFTIYNMSHGLMIPLSTRNVKQRDSLALVSDAAIRMIPGILVTLVMPVMIRAFGVGSDSQMTWIKMMSILSIFALPAALIEYYFTKERVTEEQTDTTGISTAETVPYLTQMKACFKDKYFVMIILFTFIWHMGNGLYTNGLLYYSNWVLGNSVDSGTGLQVLVSAVGQAPMGLGVFILYPLIRKFGKRPVALFGFAIGALGTLICLIDPSNLGIVLVGLLIRNFGLLPSYILAAQLADALDHVEWKNGFRADGFAISINTIIITVCVGFTSSIVLGGIDAFGYITPESTAQIINQPDAIKNFFTFCYIGGQGIAALLGVIIMIFFNVEKLMPQISADIVARRKAEAAARGEVYISPEEKIALEQAELEKVAEEKRIEELKAKCQKKGLDFDTENNKYLEKLAAKQAKEDAKLAKKKKK